jgi:hypothetical protein
LSEARLWYSLHESSKRLPRNGISAIWIAHYPDPPCSGCGAFPRSVPSAEPKTLNFSVLHAQDRCDQSSDGGIVVCGKRRDPDRFRIPEALRHAEVVPRADEIQARLGPSALCQQAGNFTCSKAAIDFHRQKRQISHWADLARQIVLVRPEAMRSCRSLESRFGAPGSNPTAIICRQVDQQPCRVKRRLTQGAVSCIA